MKRFHFLTALAASTFLAPPAFATCAAVSSSITDCNPNVGISKNAPTYPLDVTGDMHAGGIVYSGAGPDAYIEGLSGTGYVHGTTALNMGYASTNSIKLSAAGTLVGVAWDPLVLTGNSVTINGATEAATSLGVGAFAPGAQSRTYYPVGYSSFAMTDAGSPFYAVNGGGTGMADTSMGAIFTNDTSLVPETALGMPMYSNVTSVIHDAATSAGQINNVIGMTVVGVNESPSGTYAGYNTNAMAGFYANITCKGTGSSIGAQCWGDNPEVNINSGATDASAAGIEIDINNDEATAAGAGLAVTGRSSQSGNATKGGFSAIAVQLFAQSGQNRAQWQHGIYMQPGSSRIGMEIGQTANSGSNLGSIPIYLDYTNGSSPGALALAATSTGALSIDGAAGVSCPTGIAASTFRATNGIVTHC